MSDFYDGRERIELVGTLDASGANSVTWAPGRRAYIKRLIFVTTIAHTTADATLTIGKRSVDDTGSSTHGTAVVPFTGSAINDVAFADVGKPSASVVASGVYPDQIGESAPTIYASGSPGWIELTPSQELFVTSDGGGDAGTYLVYVHFADGGFEPRNATRELTFTRA